MPSFVKKLASRAAKKAINKVVDNVASNIFDGFSSSGRILTFGQRVDDPRFKSPQGLIDYRSVFHEQLTTNWNFQTPNRSLWYVVINGFPVALYSGLASILERTTVDDYAQSTDHHQTFSEYNSIVGQSGAIPNHPNLLAPGSELQNLHSGEQMTGCLFAQGCQIPQESMGYSRTPVNQGRGFIPGVVAEQRNQFNPLVLEFRETNISFVDVVLRPWVVLASHYGLVTYPEEDTIKNIKTHIDIYQLALTNNRYTGHVIRKKFSFFNCVPFQIAQQSATHDVDGGAVPPIDTQWMYSHYEFSVDKNAQLYSNKQKTDVMSGRKSSMGADAVAEGGGAFTDSSGMRSKDDITDADLERLGLQ